MLFATVAFGIFFFVVFFTSWSLVKHDHYRKIFLIAASYFFYGYWDYRFCFLLLFVSTFSYVIGKYIEHSQNATTRKRLLVTSVTINLAVLGFFKYYGFFTTSFVNMLASIGVHANLPLIEIILPVGISFFTFQALSYVMDVYRGDIPACNKLTDVLLYISFFPQLVAGPIVRAADFLPQLNTPPKLNEIFASRAFLLILGGLFKKMIVANYLATELVDPVFEDPVQYSSLDNLFAVYGYAFQIYCDFSAYSDIAIGVALLLGYQFRDNFNQPYRAFTIQDFWRRWHISLSSWLRDYLYIPLGGNRKGKLKTYRNLLITMVLGGLWHGAAWNFLLWGALHGGALAIERAIFKKFKIDIKSAFTKVVMTVALFHFIGLTWIYFRASTFDTASVMISQIGMFSAGTTLITPFVVILLLLGVMMNFFPKSGAENFIRWFGNRHPVVQGVIVGLVLIILGAMSPDGVAPFIYFQF